MKKIWILLIMIFFTVGVVNAQKRRTTKRVQIKVPVECQACQHLIERYFKREPGIVRMQISYRKNLVRVMYNSERTTPSRIRNTIAYLGFNADTVKANPESQRRLPPCCRPKGVKSDREERLSKEEQKYPKKGLDTVKNHPSLYKKQI